MIIRPDDSFGLVPPCKAHNNECVAAIKDLSAMVVLFVASQGEPNSRSTEVCW